MSPTDPLSASPENDPSAREDDSLAPLSPEAVDRKPILGGKKKKSPETEVAKPQEKATDSPPEKEMASAAPSENPPASRKKKVHAPDPVNRPTQPVLPLGDDEDLEDLPELPTMPAAPDTIPSSTDQSSGESPDEAPVGVLPPAVEEREAAIAAESVLAAEEGSSAPAYTPEVPAQEPVAQEAGLEDPTVDPVPESPPRNQSDAAPAWSLDQGEKKWMILLLAGLLVTGVFFYVMLRSGLPSSSVHLAQAKPDLPIEGTKVIIEELTIDWKDTGSGSAAGGLNDSTLFPRVTLRFREGSTGAVRIFFRDEREHQVGDTENFEIGGSNLARTIVCTEGLRSRIEYDGLRSRETNRWTLEIYEGANPQGPLSEFKLLVRVTIPWNLERNPSP